jgi:Peptidase family M48
MMVRYLIAAVVGCLFIGGSALTVRKAGEHYRAGLHQTARLARDNERVSHSPSTKDTPSPSIAAANVEPASSKPASSAPAPPAVAKPSPKTAADNPVATAPSFEVAKAQPAIATPEKNTNAVPKAKAAPADPLANDPYWNQPDLKKRWDVTYLKPDEERELRDILHEVIVHFNPLVADQSPWLSRVEEAAERFKPMLQRKEITYKFFILDSDVVNAFSIPGGNVYISRGLFNLIGEDEDYALEFVIGHEIAHVDRQHAIECLKMKGMKELPRGTIFKLYALILPFGYVVTDKINQEFDADDWVCNKMIQNQRSRREILALLQKLEGYSRDHGFFSGRMPPQPGRDLSPVENHYRAQVSARERLKHLKELIGQPAAASK